MADITFCANPPKMEGGGANGGHDTNNLFANLDREQCMELAALLLDFGGLDDQNNEGMMCVNQHLGKDCSFDQILEILTVMKIIAEKGDEGPIIEDDGGEPLMAVEGGEPLGAVEEDKEYLVVGAGDPLGAVEKDKENLAVEEDTENLAVEGGELLGKAQKEEPSMKQEDNVENEPAKNPPNQAEVEVVVVADAVEDTKPQEIKIVAAEAAPILETICSKEDLGPFPSTSRSSPYHQDPKTKTWTVSKVEMDDSKDRKVKIDHMAVTMTEPSPVTYVTPLNYYAEVENYNFIVPKKMYIFKVVNAINPSLFYLEYIADRKPNEFDVCETPTGYIPPMFWSDMQFFYSLENLPKEYKLVTEPKKRRLYACRYESTYERVNIIGTEPITRRANVAFIDLGFRKWVRWDSLYELASIFTDPPARAFQCFLVGIRPKRPIDQHGGWNDEIRGLFQEMVLEKRVQAIVRSKTIQTFEDTTIPQCKLGVSLYLLRENVVPGSSPTGNGSLQMRLIEKGWAVAEKEKE